MYIHTQPQSWSSVVSILISHWCAPSTWMAQENDSRHMTHSHLISSLFFLLFFPFCFSSFSLFAFLFSPSSLPSSPPSHPPSLHSLFPISASNRLDVSDLFAGKETILPHTHTASNPCAGKVIHSGECIPSAYRYASRSVQSWDSVTPMTGKCTTNCVMNSTTCATKSCSGGIWQSARLNLRQCDTDGWKMHGQ